MGNIFYFLFKGVWYSDHKKTPSRSGQFLREEASVATLLFLFYFLFFLLLLLLLLFTGFEARKSNSSGKGDKNGGCNYFFHNLRFRLLSYEPFRPLPIFF